MNLQAATNQIRQAIDQSREQDLPSPFFFMVGAGISSPPIPLSAAMQTQCEDEARKYGKDTPPPSTLPLDTYSHWFEQAYPQPINRQRYLRRLMEKSVISRANFRLAHLMLEKTVTNIVVTTNFDDFTSRALSLFGLRHIVCDHPRTLERVDLQSKDVQIIHIHGSYWFYDCCNLKDEILRQAQGSPSTSFTMLTTLDHILTTRSPLVVGYSGWEGDVFMTALRRRLSAPLGANIYWFCYKKRDADNLPDWLRSHPNVCMVVPDTGAPFSSATPIPAAAPLVSPEALAHGNPATGNNPASNDPSLQAITVFDKLIAGFGLEVPPVIENPLGFFAGYLRQSLLGDSAEDTEGDVYAIRSVIEKVERAQSTVQPSPSESILEPFRNAVRRSDHRTAIHLASDIVLDALSAEQLKEAMSALTDAALALNDNSPDELESYDLVAGMGARLDRLNAGDSASRSRVARALYNKSVTLGVLNQNQEAIQTYDELIKRFSGSPETSIRENLAKALLNKGVRLAAMDRAPEEIAAYEELIRQFGDAPEPAVREQVAMGLGNKGITLGNLNRPEEAITAYDDLVRRFGSFPEPVLREQVAKAFLNKGVTLAVLHRDDGALAAYDQVIRQFADSTSPGVRETVIKAMFNKGNRLASLNRLDEAVAAYDEVANKFADVTELAYSEWVSKALLNKGQRLSDLNRQEDAIAAYDELVKRFGNSTEPVLRAHAATALLDKGVALGSLQRDEAALTVYDEVVGRFGTSTTPALRETVVKALFNKGNRLSNLGRTQESINAYEEVANRYADATDVAYTEWVAKALFNKGQRLAELNRTQEELAAYDEIVRRFGSSSEPVLTEYVTRARAERDKKPGSQAATNQG